MRLGSAARDIAAAAAPIRQDNDRIVETSIPARLDHLPWSGFHTRVVLALGITWILDGLEVTLAGALAGALKESPAMRFSNFDVGFANSAYLAGAVLGALGFGWLTDRIGRKKLFFITLALYGLATAATAFSFDLWTFCLCRFLTGAGIGGEYSAINSTIQELIPARMRGHTDLAINGSFSQMIFGHSIRRRGQMSKSMSTSRAGPCDSRGRAWAKSSDRGPRTRRAGIPAHSPRTQRRGHRPARPRPVDPATDVCRRPPRP